MKGEHGKVQMNLSNGQKIYFASDFHLGVPSHTESLLREKKIVAWLQQISKDAAAIFLIGDLFDFWFEYKTVVPKGFVRFQGAVAKLTDQGIPVFVIPGNHDLWMKSYLSEELGVQILRPRATISVGEKTIFIAHGDGLGKASMKYKLTKSVFTSPFLQWAYRWLHPDWGVRMAQFFSDGSRAKKQHTEKEHTVLIDYCHTIESQEHHDLYVFGHVHDATDREIGDSSRYINLGEWFNQGNYLVLDENSATLHHIDH